MYNFCYSAFAQHKAYTNENEIWLKGVAYLASGEKINGEINYNYISETLRVKKNGQIKTYVAKNINRFTVYDSIRNKSQYYSFPLTQTEDYEFLNPKLRVRDIKKAYHFFLIKHQNSKGAILSNLDIDYGNNHQGSSLFTDANGNVQQYDNSPGTFSSFEKTLERIYFLDKRGIPLFILEGKVDKKSTFRLDPFFNYKKYQFSNFDSVTAENAELSESNNFKSVKKYKLVNKDFLEELDPRNYKKLEAYIDSNDIDIKTVEGLTQLIDYWAEI